MITIEDYKKEDGYYHYNGMTFNTAQDMISEMLDFCGCGMPDEAIDFVYKALNLVKINREMKYDDWYKEVKKLLPNHGVEYFVWYYLDSKEFTEHGGSVPGWLTEEGVNMMRLIEDYAKIRESYG